MITIRPSAERGETNIGWLDSRHTFSFNQYHDPKHMGFRALRVINDDRVAPGMGFGRHGHSNMEIITWVITGALEHQDSTGAKAVLRPGAVQRMSAGSGIQHSEYNHSKTEPVHFYQIWIQPAENGISPRFEDREFAAEGRQNRWQLITSPDGREGTPPIEQDAFVSVADVAPGVKLPIPLASGRHAWLQVATGSVTLNSVHLHAGDGAAISEESNLEVTGIEQADLILFDLA